MSSELVAVWNIDYEQAFFICIGILVWVTAFMIFLFFLPDFWA
jgi:hypothetical protein